MLITLKAKRVKGHDDILKYVLSDIESLLYFSCSEDAQKPF